MNLGRAAETGVVAALAAAVRAPGLRQEPWGDELYHILAAREYLVTGTFGINGGSYERTGAFTEMVAALYQLFGVSPAVARLPAFLAGVLTVVVLFVWLRRVGERTAAWVGSIVLIATPALIEQSQYARFYPLQHLFLLIGAAALWLLIDEPARLRTRLALGAAAVLSLAVALYFQKLTIIGGAGVALGAALAGGPALLGGLPPRRRAAAVAGVLGAALLVAAAAWSMGVVERFAALATYADMWAEGSRSEIRFYHWIYLEDFPVVWTLLPAVLLLAFVRQPRLALYAGAVFVVVFTTHTLLAWKAERYVSYAHPFFAVLVGLAAAQAVPWIRTVLHQAVPERWTAARAVRGAWAAAIIGFLLISNSAFPQTARLMLRDQAYLYPGGATPTLSWAEAAPVLAPHVAAADALVSTEDLEAFWFFGRLDYVLDRDHLLQGGASPEFSIDRKIMTPMIGSTESLQQVVACHPTGVLVAMRWALGSYKMAAATADYIRATLEPVELPGRTGLVAYRWNEATPRIAAGCPAALRAGAP